ncbi:hypothetical protein YPPY47_4123 [Yersinia pestis PY-47]|nr:hypothetical protein YPC_4256 [Yersinia pestis biovar Medievalis str. Harbin 35]EDR41982.1 hypothetical protein YpE1979001_4590 [Yersinia pestis biovar Antiqua str. E1979001]EDR51282.1 hypothetical protein YpB42003004_4119 [Yersinia pestis biovar Antiqua str. B42003004]EEO74304.1 hypothetical protein YP516_3898 [Yersinia pestis Nepal516]EEO79332.1 hypothetical protein YPF_4261 [Yersinia pestis biovar Orientalis str. India 195]EEO85614.1 hypothetical protein YPH_1480 [Yersinia pestis biovar 
MALTGKPLSFMKSVVDSHSPHALSSKAKTRRSGILWNEWR